MYSVNVQIQSLADAQKGIPVFKDIDPQKMERADSIQFAILEAGMQSGKTSTMICLKTADGRFVYGELSAEMFDGLASAVKGAVQRFGR